MALPGLAGLARAAALTLTLAMALTAALAGGTARAQQPPPPQPAVTFEKSELAIRKQGGGEVKFVVEMAVTPQQKAHGLMFRQRLDPYGGMLFDFGRPQPISMWMKNTLIPLDMVFIAEDGQVISIAANTVPMSTDTISSGGPALAVLEIAGGTARLLGIRPGDRAVHPIFERR